MSDKKQGKKENPPQLNLFHIKPSIQHYNTLADACYAEYREKGSKFLAYAEHTADETMVQLFLERLHKEHPKATHICYAYRLDAEGKFFRANDDGEPSGTAGKPILNQIDSKVITACTVAVVRYFGGVKLGVAGLVSAYKTAAAEALKDAAVKAVKLQAHYRLMFNYERMNDVMRALRREGIKIVEQGFDTQSFLICSVPLEEEDNMLADLQKLYDVTVLLLKR